jgi:prepilin-type processing-associated H-X9-DG protein
LKQQLITKRAAILTLIIIGFGLGALTLIGLINARGATEISANSGKEACNLRMRMIYSAILAHSRIVGDVLPANLEELVEGKYLESSFLYCPSDSARRRYRYVSAGKSLNSSPDTVIMTEELGNHSLAGGNVLFVDGHVEFWSSKKLLAIKGSGDKGGGGR